MIFEVTDLHADKASQDAPKDEEGIKEEVDTLIGNTSEDAPEEEEVIKKEESGDDTDWEVIEQPRR